MGRLFKGKKLEKDKFLKNIGNIPIDRPMTGVAVRREHSRWISERSSRLPKVRLSVQVDGT